MAVELVKDQTRRPCNDCGAEIGEEHVAGCDHERCPKCDHQLIGCNCFVDTIKGKSTFDEEAYKAAGPEKWSGIYFEKEKLYCEEHNLYSYLAPGRGWVRCGKDHPEASHDINSALIKMQEERYLKNKKT